MNEEEEEEMEEMEETPIQTSRQPISRHQRNMREEGDQNIEAWLESLGVHENFRVKIDRKKPQTVRIGKNPVDIAGWLATREEKITEEDIKQEWGGGTYTITILRPDTQGRFVYFKGRTVKIPGHPIVDGVDLGEMEQQSRSPRNGEDGLGGKAFDFARHMFETQKRAPQENSVIVQSLMEQLTAMRTELGRKDSEMLRIIAEQNAKPDGAAEVMKSMWGQESGRLESMRAQHESELRMMRENAREDIKRSEAQRNAEISRLESAQLREIDNLTRAHAQQLETMKLSYQTQMDGLKFQIDTLNRSITKLEAENGELRAKKDKSLPDQLMEINSMKEVFDNVLGGNEEKPKWYESLAQTVMENPEAIQRIVGMTPATAPAQLPAAPQASAPVETLPPIGQPYRAPDGKVYVRDEAGVTHELSPEQVQELQQLHAQQQAAAAQEARKPDASELKLAIRFIESAVQNGTDPEAFAESARTMIPADIMRYLEEVGPDDFINNVGNLEPGSPLRTQNGRNFVRKVAKFLLTGTTGG